MILSRTKKAMIEDAIKKTQSHDPQKLCECICNDLVNKYACDKSLNIALKRMNLSTTKDIYDMIKYYLAEVSKKENKLPERKYTIWS